MEQWFQRKEDAMKCAICRGGKPKPDEQPLCWKEVRLHWFTRMPPAEVCDNCGEEYLSVEINRKLLKQAEQAAERGVDLEMLRYAA